MYLNLSINQYLNQISKLYFKLNFKLDFKSISTTCAYNLLLICTTNQSWATDLNANLNLSFLDGGSNPYQTQSGESTLLSRQQITLEAQHSSLTSRAALFSERNERQERFNTGHLLELYWEQSVGPWELTAGKKMLEWGVGYGFQPLNLFNAKDQRTLVSELSTGLAMMNAEYFTQTGAWMLFCAQDESETQRPRRNRCGIRLYQLVGQWDLQSLLYYDEDHHFAMGGSVSGVTSDSTEWHGSLLIQQRYQNTEYQPAPVVVDHDYAVKALLGFTYTSVRANTLIGELWHDGSAEHAIDEPRSQLLLSLSHDGESTDPTVDLLYSIDDKGVIFTLRFAHEFAADYNLSYGVRSYQGPKNSFYRQAADKHLSFIELSLSF